MEKVCKKCGEKKDISKFAPYTEERKKGLTRNICRKCKTKKQIELIKNNPERLAKTKEYMKIYYKKNNHIGKVKSYRSSDRKKNVESITLSQFKDLINKTPFCFYCEATDINILGLDRIDNTKGHSLNNVVVCCEKCNNILSDIPYEAKLCLKQGLKEIKNNNYLKNWTIGTKRNKKI